MLYITYTLRGVGGVRNQKNLEWHVGNSVPEIGARVVTFQADGHELEVIMQALRAHSMETVAQSDPRSY